MYGEYTLGEQPQREQFTNFVSEEVAETCLQGFCSEDFFACVPLLREVGRVLNAELPEARLDSEGLPTDLFNYGPNTDDKIIETLGPRHEFDLWFLEELGSVLDTGHTPADYFVFGQYLTSKGAEHDWEAFRRIQIAIVIQPSPLIMSFTDPSLIANIANWEPLELALRYLGYGRDSVGEITWMASKTYMFSQEPPFSRINQGLEFEDAKTFLTSIVDVITPYLAAKMKQYPEVADDIGNEYLCDSFELVNVWRASEELINEKFAILHMRSWNRPSTLLVNAIIHNELCHVIMKNVNSWYESAGES